VLLVLAFSATARAQTAASGANAVVRDASGRVVATADFREGRGEVLITLTFSVPPALEGSHAVHVNELGRCDPPDFASSGAIFNPTNKPHGRQNPEGAEVGDLPNVNFSTGLTAYNTTAIGATLAAGPTSLLESNRALVIFSGQDDQLNGPEGNAGSRIACGVIQPASAAPAAAAAPVAASPSVAAVKPASSPIVVVAPSKPVAVAASPQSSPVPVAAALPTPLTLPPTPTAQTSNSLSPGNAFILAVLGAALLVLGYLLRQQRTAR
jgi:Cu-Zn family superoxide dismutase